MAWNKRKKIIPLLGLVSLTAVIGLLLSANPVKADPHAVFYTAIGQQQLFFNVLAALDQADYVESSGSSITDQPKTREDLLESRGNVSAIPRFTEEQSRLITSTETNLSSLVTRPITLEGADLYTDYLVRSLAIESAQRDSSSRLALAQCEKVYGAGTCIEEGGPQFFVNNINNSPLNRSLPSANNNNPAVNGISTDFLQNLAGNNEVKAAAAPRPGGNNAKPGTPEYYNKKYQAAEAERVVDPLAWGAQYVTHGVVPALLSGSGLDKEKEYRQAVKDSDNIEGVELTPFAFSPDIALARKYANDKGGTTGAALHDIYTILAANSIRTHIDGVYWNYARSEFPFANLKADPNGVLILDEPADQTLKNKFAQISRNTHAQSHFSNLASAAGQRVLLQQKEGEKDGVKSDAIIKDWHAKGAYSEFPGATNRKGDPVEGQLGELSLEFKEPVAVPAGAASDITKALRDGSYASEYTSTAILERDGTAAIPATETSIRSSSNNLSAVPEDGQVAGITTRQLISPAINSRYPYKEPGQSDLVQLLYDRHGAALEKLDLGSRTGFSAP